MGGAAPVGPAQDATTEESLLDRIVNAGHMSESKTARDRGVTLIRDFVAHVLEGPQPLGKDADKMVATQIAHIDHLISRQLNKVLHHPSFQKLESSWRG